DSEWAGSRQGLAARPCLELGEHCLPVGRISRDEAAVEHVVRHATALGGIGREAMLPAIEAYDQLGRALARAEQALGERVPPEGILSQACICDGEEGRRNARRTKDGRGVFEGIR